MNKLRDAVVFSRKYRVNFKDIISKARVEELSKGLIQGISQPLSHKGIILGHIKLIAIQSEEEFIFLSVTRLDAVDVKPSSKWLRRTEVKVDKIDFEINVLLYGHKHQEIEQRVEDELLIFRSKVGEIMGAGAD